jgi:hypothetical protein
MLFTFYSDVTTGYVWVYVICSLLSSLPLISSFQVKREELLQYAQGAIAGLKIYADLERWSRNLIFYSWKLGLQWVYYFIFFICNSRYYVSKWLLHAWVLMNQQSSLHFVNSCVVKEHIFCSYMFKTWWEGSFVNSSTWESKLLKKPCKLVDLLAVEYSISYKYAVYN